MDLSVVIVNWNTKGDLLHCLASLIQTAPEEACEVIVVDNGSTDGSADAVKGSFPSVRVIENDGNFGFSRAANQGLRGASGRYLLLLNPDTEVKKGSLRRLVTFMEGHPEAGCAGPRLLHADGTPQNSIANFPSLVTELLNKSLLRRFFPGRYPGKERFYPEPIPVDSVIGACMIVRRKVIEEVGLLDEDYFLFLEETDWCYRMKRAGWKVYHVPGAEVIHYQGKGAEQDRKGARVEYYRSRYRYFRKNKGPWQVFLLFAGLMVRLTMELILTSLANLFTLFTRKKWRKRFSVYACLLGWHLKGCPEGMGLKPLKSSLKNSHCKINVSKCF